MSAENDTKPCGFGVDGGECYACQLERQRSKQHSEGCHRRRSVAGQCTCVERVERLEVTT
jgi:hypothetical protein